MYMLSIAGFFSALLCPISKHSGPTLAMRRFVNYCFFLGAGNRTGADTVDLPQIGPTMVSGQVPQPQSLFHDVKRRGTAPQVRP